MLVSRVNVLVALAVLAAGAMARDILDEVQDGFRMALRPRAVANLQTFQSALGGARASAITDSGDPSRQFEVDGDTFPDFQTAADRACDNQHNVCAQISNNKTGNFPVSACDQQNTQCKAAASSATQTAFNALTSSNSEFDFFCDI